MHDDQLVVTARSNRDLPSAVRARQDRQRAEIVGGVDAGRLHRAADLAHEHLAEFPSDRFIRTTIIAALESSSDERVHRRAREFATN